MPTISANDPVLSRMRGTNWRVDRMLPDAERIYRRSIGLILPSYLQAESALASAMIYQESSQYGLGAILQNVGIPAYSVFRTTMDVLDVNVISDVTAGLERIYGGLQDAVNSIQAAGDAAEGGAALAQSVEMGVGMAINGVAAVPIGGWIIKAAWAVGKFIKGIVQIAKSAADYGKVNAIYPVARFDPMLDNMVLNSVIADLRNQRDWSRRFGPPQMGTGRGTGPDYWLKKTESGAFELTRAMGWDGGEPIDWQSARWTGMVPGSSYIVRGVRVQKEGAVASVMGPSLLPSAQKVLLWVWSSIVGKKGNGGPAMYTIDTGVPLLWGPYIHGMHKFIYDSGKLNDTQKQAMIRALNKDRGGNPIFNWGTNVRPTESEIDNYTPVKQAKALRKRQFAFLDTMLVAYIDDDFAAIKGDAELRDKWRKRRRDLLEHPARCDVDLSNVPDRAYADALREHGAAAGMCLQASRSFAIAPAAGGFGSKGGPDSNPYAKGPKREGAPVGGVSFLPLLALGAGMYYGYRKGYLKGLPLIG